MRFIFLIFLLHLLSAPAPAAIKKKLAPHAPPIHLELGIELSLNGTSWEHVPLPHPQSGLHAVFKSPSRDYTKTQAATLTVRTEKLGESKNLKEFVRQWLKEYPKFGYDVLGSRGFTLSQQEAVVVDLVGTHSKKQARQILLLKGDDVVLFTCLDNKDHFEVSLKDCNTIIKSTKF